MLFVAVVIRRSYKCGIEFSIDIWKHSYLNDISEEEALLLEI